MELTEEQKGYEEGTTRVFIVCNRCIREGASGWTRNQRFARFFLKKNSVCVLSFYRFVVGGANSGWGFFNTVLFQKIPNVHEPTAL